MRAFPPHRATATVAGLFVIGVLLGSWAGRAAVARATDPYAGLERFARMLTAIEVDYVEPIHNEKLVDAAIAGMVRELDPHSRWMSAQDVSELRADAEGHVVGFGVELQVHDGGIRITRVLTNSPAELEGLRIHDRILALDGVPLAGLSLAEVDARMSGERGEVAALTVLRDGWAEPQTLNTRRDTVKVAAIESHRFGDVLYVRFIDFQRSSARELRDAVAAERGLEGLVLDLRDNTGGLLDEAVGVVDLFQSEGMIVSVRGRKHGIESHVAKRSSLDADLKLSILINHYSASASEIVAGALQESGRAELIGSPTYGKGSVQQLYRNPDGSALKLTVARYHLPSGHTIPAKEGLVPDILVDLDHRVPPSKRLRAAIEGLEISDEEQEKMLAWVGELSDPQLKHRAIRWSLPPKARAEQDPVINMALERMR